MRFLLSFLALVPLIIGAGPISKFDRKAPVIFRATASMEDVERCLIDIGNYGPANVYQQADRPNVVTILWSSGSGTAVARVDLARESHGTQVASWFEKGVVEACVS